MVLSDYLEQQGLRVVDVAKGLGVPYPTAHKWVFRRRTPRPARIAAIKAWSAGAVTADDWLPEPAPANGVRTADITAGGGSDDPGRTHTPAEAGSTPAPAPALQEDAA